MNDIVRYYDVYFVIFLFRILVLRFLRFMLCSDVSDLLQIQYLERIYAHNFVATIILN